MLIKSSPPRRRRAVTVFGAVAAAGALALLAAPLGAAAAVTPEPDLPIGTPAAAPLGTAGDDATARADDDGKYTLYRYDGATRYEVAANVTLDAFAPGVPVLYIASGEKYPDALSAGPAAAEQGGGLLLVTPDAIPAATREAITELKPQKLVVVGGTASVSTSVYDELVKLQPNTVRIDGADRYEVSRNIVDYAFCGLLPGTIIDADSTGTDPVEPLPIDPGDPAACLGDGLDQVFVATGTNYPDALAAGPAASYVGGGVLLVPGWDASLDEPTHELLTRTGASVASIAGGPASVSDGIEADLADSLATTVRYSGADRFEVAATINEAVFPAETDVMFMASGAVFPDALSAGPVAAVYDAPLFLVRSNCYPPVTADAIFFGKFALDDLVIMGGYATVDRSFEDRPHYC